MTGSQIRHLFKRGWRAQDSESPNAYFISGYEAAVDDIADYVDTGRCLWLREPHGEEVEAEERVEQMELPVCLIR